MTDPGLEKALCDNQEGTTTHWTQRPGFGVDANEIKVSGRFMYLMLVVSLPSTCVHMLIVCFARSEHISKAFSISEQCTSWTKYIAPESRK